MKTLKISNIIKANMEISVLNIIKHYFWYGRDIKEHFNDKLKYNEYEFSSFCIERDMTKEEIKNYYIDFIYNLRNDKNFKEFIKTLKYYEIKKVTNKELLEIHHLNIYFKSWNDIQSFISNTLYKEIM